MVIRSIFQNINNSIEMWGSNPTYRAECLIPHLTAEVVFRPDATRLNAREMIKSPAWVYTLVQDKCELGHEGKKGIKDCKLDLE